jgi:hypothetical protein
VSRHIVKVRSRGRDGLDRLDEQVWSSSVRPLAAVHCALLGSRGRATQFVIGDVGRTNAKMGNVGQRRREGAGASNSGSRRNFAVFPGTKRWSRPGGQKKGMWGIIARYFDTDTTALCPPWPAGETWNGGRNTPSLSHARSPVVASLESRAPELRRFQRVTPGRQRGARGRGAQPSSPVGLGNTTDHLVPVQPRLQLNPTQKLVASGRSRILK